MKIDRAASLSLALVVLAFALSGAFYARLPESMPAHWNADDVVDRWIAKP